MAGGLGAFNPSQATQDILQALEEIRRELAGNTTAVRTAGRGGGSGGSSGGGGGGLFGGAGAAPNPGAFLENYAHKVARGAAVNVASGLASDAANFGFSSASDVGSSLGYQGLKALRNVPGVGDLVGQAVNPLEAAGNRVSGITSRAARLGMTVDPNVRKALFETFHAQEARGQLENLEVKKLERQELGKNLDGTGVEAALKSASQALEAFAQKVNNLFGSSGRQR